MSSDQMVKTLIPMLTVAEAAAAVGASLRLRREERQVAPELRARLDAVLDVLGIHDAVDGLAGPRVPARCWASSRDF